MKIDIYGNGAEIVIGKLSQKQTEKIFLLLSKKDDGQISYDVADEWYM